MFRSALKLAVGACAIVGLFTIVLWGWRIMRADEPAPDVIVSTPSPGSKHKATLATWAGGGGIAPYCHDRLTVSAADLPQDEAIVARLTVFAAECSSFQPEDGRIKNSPKIEWDGDSKLKIIFSIGATAQAPETVKLRKQDVSGSVAIEFEVRK